MILLGDRGGGFESALFDTSACSLGLDRGQGTLLSTRAAPRAILRPVARRWGYSMGNSPWASSSTSYSSTQLVPAPEGGGGLRNTLRLDLLILSRVELIKSMFRGRWWWWWKRRTSPDAASPGAAGSHHMATTTTSYSSFPANMTRLFSVDENRAHSKALGLAARLGGLSNVQLRTRGITRVASERDPTVDKG
ncbi:hypothetical protein M406DRAFT_326210 [Cryphonectria parasitica EP155]|uniref:Uncharacterized protein n=1 Tax=Cryphonectria parasitica (strain ATCC 38755 / EP155) TaxID=660469 RepID=A0A9P4YCF2_CRYP1|nr:uncharacterized protein M406DRAFT_326210 [Cryphonectria parasitica EP155]KAF3770788.1 hypothetical protein M406DRAFT_326210 [Cryphonectria parasitica EP155]